MDEIRLLKSFLGKALECYGPPEILNSDQALSSFARLHELPGGPDTQISMDGKGAWRDNVFIKRFLRSLKREHVYLQAYDGLRVAKEEIGAYMELLQQRTAALHLDRFTPVQG